MRDVRFITVEDLRGASVRHTWDAPRAPDAGSGRARPRRSARTSVSIASASTAAAAESLRRSGPPRPKRPARRRAAWMRSRGPRRAARCADRARPPPRRPRPPAAPLLRERAPRPARRGPGGRLRNRRLTAGLSAAHRRSGAQQTVAVFAPGPRAPPPRARARRVVRPKLAQARPRQASRPPPPPPRSLPRTTRSPPCGGHEGRRRRRRPPPRRGPARISATAHPGARAQRERTPAVMAWGRAREVVQRAPGRARGEGRARPGPKRLRRRRPAARWRRAPLCTRGGQAAGCGHEEPPRSRWRRYRHGSGLPSR